jgi:methylmalonyl-CoA mutase
MTVPPDELPLAAEFPPGTRAEWRTLALAVLRKAGAVGADDGTEVVEGRLATTTYDGIETAALYDAGAPLPATGLPGFAPYTRGSRAAGPWSVRQRHGHPDPETARAAIMADLEHGVDSLWLTLGDAGLPVDALPTVLRDVYLDLATVTLDAGPQTPEAAEAFLALIDERHVRGDVTANLGADPLGWRARTGEAADPDATDLAATAALAKRCAEAFPGVRAITVDATVYHDAGGSDAEELGTALAAGVAYLRALTGVGLDVDTALDQLEFRYAATADQFLTIAKFRAARRVWAKVVAECGGINGGQNQHAVTSSAMMTARDPWVNLLRTTLACFGAGIGGAGAVTVQPFDAELGLPDDFARRIARNTQALLVEEANVARVTDAAGGSWYVESLTEELAQAAWAHFTEIERAGGFVAALDSGLIADRLAATWAARAADLAHRWAPITGVSEFPNLTERLPVRQPAPARPAGGLPRIRYAQEFEALRDRSDAHPVRPRVFLATLGPVAAHTARATFAANLFQAGGIETPRPPTAGADPAELAAAFTASGATVACLCGTDKLYAEHAEPVAAALREAGATSVWLAGKGQYVNVDGYLYAGCDAIAVLRTTLTELGVA